MKKKTLAMKEDFRTADLSPQDRAMMEYAEKITLAPWSVTEADVESLRASGWNDVQILEIATVSSYRNYIARVASALGVEVDDANFSGDAETRAALDKGLV